MDSSTPWAPSMVDSNSGELMACSAAFITRLSPRAEPTPMSAEPASAMTERTSAKSTLMRPGIVIRSVMPCTPLCSTWSAARKASIMVRLDESSCNSRSLGMTMSVSHTSRKASMPCSACLVRFFPSKLNGRVTTPTVSAPIFLAMEATTGAAPVPVPPPSPAVTNTMSAPLRVSSISLLWSSADCRPTSGLAPAPRPRVASRPISSLTSASENMRACESVFTAMNSTPFKPSSIMRFTALTPPPPTPTTLSTARKLSWAFINTTHLSV